MGDPDLDIAVHSTERDEEYNVGDVPYSLLAVAALVILGWVTMFVPTLSSTLLRTVLSIPLLLFAPGYALLSAIAPEGKNAVDEDDEGRFRGLDMVERISYSVVFSFILVPLLGFTLDFTPGGIRFVPVVAVISLVTLTATGVGIYRWRSLHPHDRFSLGVGRHLSLLWNDLFTVRTSRDRVLNVILVVAVVVAGGGIVYDVVAAPDNGHSEVFIATENEDGSLAFDDYPTNVTRGEPGELVVGLVNREGERQTYTVAVVLQRVEEGDVTERRLLNRYEPTLANGERWTQPMEVNPTMTGDRLRLSYEVYVGGGPSDIATAEPDYTVYLWIDVSPPA